MCWRELTLDCDLGVNLYAAGPVCMKDLSTLKMITNSQKLTRTLMDCLDSVHFFIEEVWVEHDIENYPILHIAVTLTMKCPLH